MTELTVLALDCAGTLYHPHHFSTRQSMVKGIEPIVSRGGSFQAIPRPSAAPFLKSFETRREIITFGLTGGSSSTQLQCLHRLGWSDYVQNVIGVYERSSVRSLNGECRWLLIDDTPASDRTTQAKLKFMSGKDRSSFTDDEWTAFLDRHFIHVQTYEGTRSDPQPLTDLTDKVMSMLSSGTARRD